MRRIPLLIGTGAVIVFGAGIVAAVATPPTGATRTEISKAVLVSGGPAEFKPGMETQVLKVVLEPGGTTGWHSHPDGGVFMVDKGVLSNYGLDGPACGAVDIPAGQAYFVPPHAHHPHLAQNHTAETVELTVYYFNVPPGTPSRLDAERPAECPADLH